ncbi:6141_t:CDS:2 [Ambispora leptoticha]|uniref:6141_t:CDS:1 n=1 Tax=Ambispora leptoticha TaxID=144679 RepID=A0A9N8ZHD8_9GLOM|nr:6141_t:CDS:2 [Ambispora leptoticha]
MFFMGHKHGDKLSGTEQSASGIIYVLDVDVHVDANCSVSDFTLKIVGQRPCTTLHLNENCHI